MKKGLKVAAATAAIGIAALSPTTPAYAGDAVGAGLIGFGVGAILGSLFTPWEVYVGPQPYYYGPVVYGPPPYYEYDYYGPPDGKLHFHNHRPPPHAAPIAHDKPQHRTATASRDNLSP
jgi:hypothetical protein